jgi:hypothetical protein
MVPPASGAHIASKNNSIEIWSAGKPAEAMDSTATPATATVGKKRAKPKKATKDMTVEERPIEYDKRACHRREGRETAQREEATTKSFVDLQLRALEVKEAWAKSILVEAEAKARLVDAYAKSKVLEDEAKLGHGRGEPDHAHGPGHHLRSHAKCLD